MADAHPREGAVTARASRVGDVLVQLLLVGVALSVDVLVRWSTLDDYAQATANARDLVGLEKAWGVHVELAVQSVVSGLPALDAFLTQFYVWGYLPVLAASLVWTYLWARREDYLWLRDSMLASGALGMVVYAAVPVAPPRLVGGYVDTVSAGSLDGVAHPAGIANEIAAVPSFHVAWLVLVAVVMALQSESLTWRAFCWAYPVVMALSVVATGNHWVLDIPAGLAVAAVGALVAQYLGRVRARRSH